jgi:hypothetical protein
VGVSLRAFSGSFTVSLIFLLMKSAAMALALSSIMMSANEKANRKPPAGPASHPSCRRRCRSSSETLKMESVASLKPMPIAELRTSSQTWP